MELEDDYAVEDYLKKRDWFCDDDKEWVREHKRTLPNLDDYDEETITLMKEGIRKLKEAEIYAQRIDWLLSGDDGEDTFKDRLRGDLLKLQAEHIKNKDKNPNNPKSNISYVVDKALETCKMPIVDDKDFFKCRLATIINYLEIIKNNAIKL